MDERAETWGQIEVCRLKLTEALALIKALHAKQVIGGHVSFEVIDEIEAYIANLDAYLKREYPPTPFE